MLVYGVISRGRKDNTSGDQWVKTYSVRIDVDGNWVDVDDKLIFDGNTDRDTPVAKYFQGAVKTRRVRIVVQGFGGDPMPHPSMRVAVIVHRPRFKLVNLNITLLGSGFRLIRCLFVLFGKTLTNI